MRNKKLFSTLTAALLAASALAQPGFSRADTVPVKIAGNYLKYPWAGGLNFCQFSAIDLNFDGIKDLFVFDRTGNRITTFINNGTPNTIDYTFAPAYRDAFPAGMEHWALLYDYDGDGLEDIFTYAGVAAAAKVYRNTSTSSGLQFTLVASVLNANYVPQNLNLYIASTDIPALIDIDNDTDVDILNFESSGTCVTYFKNLSIENYGHNDSLVFEVKNRKWGWFTESGSSNQLILNDYSNVCQNIGIPNPEKTAGPSTGLIEEQQSRHASSTLLALDMNADGVKDLLIGDGAEPTMTMVYNDGGINSSHIDSAEYSFPVLDVPIDLQLFPAAFYVDVNNDNIRDLLVSPNAPNVSENFTSVHLYLNNGTDNAPVFNFVQNDFLQEEMIETGEGAYPVFFDYDADGLTDLLIGNHAYFAVGPDAPQVSLYRNTGTPSAPAFELITRDFANLGSFGFFTMKPAFGDLDADGDEDMVIGDFNGRVHYFENSAGPGNTANFVLNQPNLTSTASNSMIDVGLTAAPQIVDVNRDGIPDLLIGARNGKLAYYRGTNPNTPVFDSITHFLGSVNVTKANSVTGYSVPFLYDYNGSYRMLVGSESGFIYQYTNIDNNLGGSFFLADSAYMNLNEGLRTAPALAYLDDDTLLDMVIGNYSGGAALFLGDLTTGMNEHPAAVTTFSLFPNPASRRVNVTLQADHDASFKLSIYNMLGQEMHSEMIITNAANSIAIDNLPAGMYYCTVHAGNFLLTKKFVVQQ